MPQPTPETNLEHAGAIATALAALLALMALTRRPLAWAGRSVHRHFGEVAFAVELKQGRETHETVMGMEPRLKNIETDLSEMKGDIRMILSHLLPNGGVRVPEQAYPAPDRDRETVR